MHQAFVDLTTPLGDESSLRLRLGRQSFLFGAQRVISPGPWNNTLNTWEGGSVLLRSGGWNVNGLLTWFVPVRQTKANERDDDRALYGIYATHDAPKGGRGLDLYAIGTTRANVTVNGTSGDERRHTLGARSFGSLGGTFDGELEGGWQTGEVGGRGVDAWFGAGLLGFRLADWSMTPRLFTGFDVASGDGRTGAGVQTYHQMFPLGHAYFGFADAVGRQNILSEHLGIALQVTPDTTASLTGHVFRLYSGNDDVYAVNGTVARADPASKDLGEEVDLLLSHHFDRHLELYGGYSHFFTGSALANPGPAADQDFFYLGAAFVF